MTLNHATLWSMIKTSIKHFGMRRPCFAFKGRDVCLLHVSVNCFIAGTQSIRADWKIHTLEANRITVLFAVGKLSSPWHKFGKTVTRCSEAGVYLLSQWQDELLNLNLGQTVRHCKGRSLPTCIDIPEPQCWILHPHSSPRGMTDKRAGLDFACDPDIVFAVVQ